MQLCLFEDAEVGRLDPLTATRPVFDLWCGSSPLHIKQRRAFSKSMPALIVRPELSDVVQSEWPDASVNDATAIGDMPVLLVNGRWVPPRQAPPVPDKPCVALIGDTVAYALIERSQLPHVLSVGIDGLLQDLRRKLPAIPAAGWMVDYPWDLIDHNAEQLASDFARLPKPKLGPWKQLGWRPAGTSLVGRSTQLLIDSRASVDPMVLFDTTNGPIRIESGAVIKAFSRIEGPCHIGKCSQVVGGKIGAGTTLGPQCRIGGEVETSIVQGYSNKYHDGFLGHSYVGSWVNLGAGCQTSDLRNDYGSVTVPLHGQPVDTGLTKVGAFIGDHVKAALSCLINTGSVIGAFAQLLPSGRLMPKYVPHFTTTVYDRLAERLNIDELMRTAGVVMQRRGKELTNAHEQLYRTLFQRTAVERWRTMREVEVRRLRKTG